MAFYAGARRLKKMLEFLKARTNEAVQADS